jgi:hypothetical protein
MRFFRQIIRDAMSGGVLAGLIAVMLLLQGGISGYAQASMLSLEGAVEIICSSSGGEHQSDDKPFGSMPQPCCQAACQIAASVAPALPCDIGPVAVLPAATAETPAIVASIHETPRLLGLSGDVRGPPRFS